jgi:hypothetical protein
MIREWTRRMLGRRSGPKTEQRLGLLSQDQFWWDRHGRRHRVSEMPLSYLLSVLSFLEQRALHVYTLERPIIPSLPWYWQLAPRRQAEAVSWLHRTPLWRALNREAATRVFGHPFGTAPEPDL